MIPQSFTNVESETPTVMFSVLNATSIVNQARLIANLIREKGYEVEFKEVISIADSNKPSVHGLLWFSLATAAHLTHAVPTFIMSKKPRIAYVTIEGLPKSGSTMYSNLNKISYVTVSKFVAKMLHKCKFRVVDVVHHAVDKKMCETAIKRSERIRKQLDEKFKDRVRIIYVGRNDPRKGLKHLRFALEYIPDEVKSQFVLLMKTNESAKKIFKGCKNVVFLEEFGSSSYVDTLSLMAANDYLIFPSLCEGFGLPVLEANAVGIPAIHSWFEPLSEFSSQDYNFVFEYEDTKMVECKIGQFWVFHDYDPGKLAEMIMFAVDVRKNSESEYREYCEKASKVREMYDYHNVYPRLLKYINVF